MYSISDYRVLYSGANADCDWLRGMSELARVHLALRAPGQSTGPLAVLSRLSKPAGNTTLSSLGPSRPPPAGNSTRSSLEPAHPPQRLSKAPSCRPKIVGVVSGPFGPPPAQGGVSGRGSAAAGGRGAAGPTRTN